MRSTHITDVIDGLGAPAINIEIRKSIGIGDTAVVFTWYRIDTQ